MGGKPILKKSIGKLWFPGTIKFPKATFCWILNRWKVSTAQDFPYSLLQSIFVCFFFIFLNCNLKLTFQSILMSYFFFYFDSPNAFLILLILLLIQGFLYLKWACLAFCSNTFDINIWGWKLIFLMHSLIFLWATVISICIFSAKAFSYILKPCST